MIMGMKSTGKKSSNKAAVKKTAVKKKASAKKLPSKPKQKSLADQLRDQIRVLSLTLDETSLKKLLQDALVLAHNERVLDDFNANTGRTGRPGASVLADIEEGRDGTYFIIILKSYRNFLSLDEMRKLIKLCRGAETARDGSLRLFAWIERERRDIKKNSKIADEGDPSLPALWEKVIGGYDLK
jgi:hypothetical protein